MAILSKPSSAAHMAVIYVTVGALLGVWTTIYYFYLRNNLPADLAPATYGPYYWCAGFMLTGLTFIIIGLALGRIGRAARHAELPPEEVTSAVARAEQTAASQAPIVTPAAQPVAAPPLTPRLAPTAGIPSNPQVPPAANVNQRGKPAFPAV